MKALQDPKIYMCYDIYTKDGDFGPLLYRWKKENKGFVDTTIIKQIGKNIKIFRKKYSRTEQGKNWRNLDTNKFMEFVDEIFNWTRKD